MLFVKSVDLNKKSFFLILFLFTFPTITFSQQLRAGVYGVCDFPVGKVSEYYKTALEEGACAELSFMENLGIVARFQIAVALPKNERIIYTKQITQSLGLWYSLFLGESGFSFEPSVEIGCMIQKSSLVPQQEPIPEKLYFDFISKISPSFRFSHPDFLNEKVEVELSPVLTIIPQKNNILTYIGARIGLLYIFD